MVPAFCTSIRLNGRDDATVGRSQQGGDDSCQMVVEMTHGLQLVLAFLLVSMRRCGGDYGVRSLATPFQHGDFDLETLDGPLVVLMLGQKPLVVPLELDQESFRVY